MGCFLKEATYLERTMLVAAATLLIKPGLYTDMAGLALVISVALLQKSYRGSSETPLARSHEMDVGFNKGDLGGLR